MAYQSLKECVLDLEKNGQLRRITDPVDPHLEMTAIHRRVFQAGGPALFYENVRGSQFPAVSNLFGTLDRAEFIFRDSLAALKKLFALKGNPSLFFKSPFSYTGLFFTLLHALPKKVPHGPVLSNTTTLDRLPQIQSWPGDGGPFILLPQVYTEDRDKPGILNSNLGMYRIQMAGNEYLPNTEAGMHYQIRRDIGIHHTKAKLANEPLRVSIFVGGPPSHAFAAVMYLPEGMPEVAFAGALNNRGFRFFRREGFVISAEADFCITGFVEPGVTKPEGPFGDHLGYYSLKHPFPVLKIEKIYHRKDAIWPFTVVGRPPQEDSVFGRLVQEIAGPVIPKVVPGIKSVHAVDASGVHPLLLAIGSERYAPYQQRKPQELLTLANSLLGYGPCSLAKYLWIAAGEDDPKLDTHDVKTFFRHMLERVDWKNDLHFQTRTTIDTLDYSGSGFNEGSKVVIAGAGNKRRSLGKKVPAGLKLPVGFGNPRMAMEGVLVLQAPPFESYEAAQPEMEIFTRHLENLDEEDIALVITADDSEFTARSLENWLWVTFTRSDPAQDIYGSHSSIEFKHWGCRGPLVIDARIKPHHAPVLEEDPAVARKVDAFGQPGKALYGII